MKWLSAVGKQDSPGGQSVRSVRRALKDACRDDLMQRLTHELDGTPLSAQASWQRMQRMTAGLDSADRGSVTEAWYRTSHAPDAHAQVVLSPEQFRFLSQRRVVDLVRDGRLCEVKSGDGKLGSRDMAQFKDYAEFADPYKHEVPLVVAGHRIEGVTYVFTSPKGARANLRWILQQMRDYEGLEFELFDDQGTRLVFSGKQSASAVRAFLGVRS